MAKSSPRQRKTEGRVMHEFKHGELKRGRRGKGGKVKSRKQAIAIALHEAGASKYDTPSERKRAKTKYRAKEKKGETGQQEREGKRRVGAKGRRESSRAMGGKNARSLTKRGAKAARSRTRKSSKKTKDELYEQAEEQGVEGRSDMTKQQLENALH